MKRWFLHSVVIFIIGCSMVEISACKKTSTTPPVITLIGPNKDTVSLNTSNFTDPGATATDAEDGTDVVSSDFSPTNPNVNLIGSYVIHYFAYDNAGNRATKNRTVVVINNAQIVAGTYTVNDNLSGKYGGAYAFTVSVSVSPTTNNQLFLNDFSGLGGDVTVTAEVSGNSVFLSPASQQPSGMPDPGIISNGSGTISSGKITSFGYTIVYSSGGSDQATASTWVKQ